MSYAEINGLTMYYETHGSGGTPLVLLHGALSAIETSFGAILPGLAQTRTVIAVEFQAHGRTTDADRPLRVPSLADDVVALLAHLGLRRVDLLGYSIGAAVALDVALRRPDLVRRLVAISVSSGPGGMHPGVLDGVDLITPELMAGSPFADEYARLAPDPDAFPTLLEKVKDMDRNLATYPDSAIAELQPPVLLIIGDSDIIVPEHSVALFRLVGGGVVGDNVGLPRSRLAVLPGATHLTVVQQTDLLLTIISRFLDAGTE